MKIVIAGGSGFIGQALTLHYLANNDDVTIIGRNKQKVENLFGNDVAHFTWQELRDSKDESFKRCDAVINLVGANVMEKRWTNHYKKILLNSRVDAIKVLSEKFSTSTTSVPVWLNASAVTAYDYSNAIIDESTAVDYSKSYNYASYLCRQIESLAMQLVHKDIRLVHLRISPPLAKNGGVLQTILPAYRLGLGGKVGNGKQIFNWILMHDFINAIDFILEHKDIIGPVNLNAPDNLTQAEQASLIAKALHRPAFLTMPSFLIKALLGQFAEELILHGYPVQPKVLLDHGFEFIAPTFQDALDQLKLNQ